MIPIQVRVTKKILEDMDNVVSVGAYPNRSEIVRDALRRHLNGLNGK
jgi:Arc/MetJ-type ribon-helix-helix transcriptional regulator